MSRQLRQDDAGAIHHVYARGNRGATIFEDSRDRVRYLRLLGRAVRRHSWSCLSYCLMTNHLHLLVETPTANLSRGMQRLHGDYAIAFNRRHGYAGHLFQGRFGAVRVTSDAQLITTVHYIAANPVEAGLCTTPDAWPWSASGARVHGTCPDWLAEERLAELVGIG